MTGLGGFWGRSGIMFVKADSATIGPSESLPVIRAQGYGWVAFDPKTGEWADERRLAAANGLDFLPWTRTRTPADLDMLLMAKKRWGSKAALLNIEIPDTRDPVFMSQCLKLMSTVGVAAVISDGWADPIGCWAGFGRWVLIPECFPEELAAYADVTGCVSHAATFGRASLPALGAYGTKWKGRLPVRSDYAYGPQVVEGIPVTPAPFIVFPGDTVTDWAGWHA
jgi:hypothetical protein